MASNRIHANDFVRLLSAAPQPIYALDEDLKIIFLNPACTEWLGSASEGLIGLRCAYHSPAGTTSPEATAAALCPPPEAIAGNFAAAIITSTCKQGVEKHRQAEFIPLGTPENLHGLVAILELEDCAAESVNPTAISSTEEPSCEELHAAIRRFRGEAAGRYSAEHLIGRSPAMQLARCQVEAAAASSCSVCISGPPGSGRERLAAAIHCTSHPEDVNVPFAQGGMVSLDCSVLPADMIQSTLAALARLSSPNEPAGLSRRHDAEAVLPATLVLNHIDDLSAELQAEMANLFVRKPFPRRLISTSTMPFAELAHRGKFRRDLAGILSTISIQLPPLKDRREDLPLLAQFFLEDCNRKGQKQVGGFSPEALDKLDAYSWPGNLNELLEIVSAAHKNAQGTLVKAEELPPQIHLSAQAAAHPRKVEEPIRLDEYLERVERELIRRAIARAKGNKAKAARLLGLTRSRLRRRMIQLGLEEG